MLLLPLLKKVYYIYDPEKGVFHRIYPTFKQRLKTYFLRTVTVVCILGVLFLIRYLINPISRAEGLRTQNSKLLSEYRVLSKKVDDALAVMEDIEKRDDNVYRVLLDADPVVASSRQINYNGTNRYAELLTLGNPELVTSTAQKIDLLERKLFAQTRSFDEIVDLYREQADRIDHLPSIQPVANKDLKRTASGYGYRIDPVYHVSKFHYGMDFTCDTGTPIYATGNGKVIYAKWKTGFGNLVEVDHGFGYVTRYAHCSKIDVKVGQNVTRGEIIARVGSTGKSTGPHLHYEVLLNGKNMNPVNYYYMDLDEEQYEEMIQMAENQGSVFD